ncbi:calcium-activated chloride channel regulator 1-like isoform X2 [Lineus longissimus]|uniref:calcium-activated chloride channel regulator 1-like isoform X2 n=1 Tax=Lineus longissimus TaxID=88925 RepID=UPI00315CCDC3
MRFDTMNIFVGTILLFLYLEEFYVHPAEIILKNNGYENVLVAISDAVQEDSRIIERIKAIFTEGSSNMFRATRYRAYFRSITILVPATWMRKPEYEAPSNDETFTKAAIRVDQRNPKKGDVPYTMQYALCGEQAKYIHLTRRFLTDVEFATKKFGPPGKTLVHEWGHFRWGLFDEYPTSTHYYIEDGEYHETQCPGSIPGQQRDKVTKGICKIGQTGLPDKNCRFEPDLNQNVTTASYMYLPFIEKIDDFCDDGTLGDDSIVHNKKAPNEQNSKCNGKSAWEVMRQSVDFKNNNNPTNARRGLNTNPSFRLIQAGNFTKVVLLFDVSGSMAGTPIIMMQQAANNFIQNIIKNGSYVGIVIFSNTARTSLEMTRIQSRADKLKVASYIPKTTNGGTAIGTGMQHAMNVLTSTSAGRAWAKGASVILMTDGQNTAGVNPLSMVPVAMELGVTFHTIGYSKASDPVLVEIAKSTGGQPFFSTSSATSADLFTAMSSIADITSRESTWTASSSVSVASVANNVEKTKGLQGNFAIDFTIGKDTTITFNYLSKSAVVEARIEAPDGSVIDKSDIANYREDRDNQIIQIDIPGTALVSRGYSTVIGLNVTAAISGRTRAGRLQTVHVGLQDKGFGIDLEASDGVYSVEFGRSLLNAEGRHSVTVLVDNPENTGKIAKFSKASSAPIIGTGSDEPVATYQTVGPIQRVASAGELRVERPSSPTLVDVLPPPRIRDLQLVFLDTAKVEVTLNWTAVGDDVSQSVNTTYDLRIGTFEEISERFENCSRIHLEGTPKNAGEEEKHKINMADYNKKATFFLAIRAIDEVGNEGDPSNIISISMTLPTKFSNGDEIVTESETSSTNLPDNISDAIATESPNLLIVPFGLAALETILIVVVIGIVYHIKKNKTSPPHRIECV